MDAMEIALRAELDLLKSELRLVRWIASILLGLQIATLAKLICR